MQSRGTSDWLRGRSMSWVDWVVALASSQMADERQSAVLGQVSSAPCSPGRRWGRPGSRPGRR